MCKDFFCVVVAGGRCLADGRSKCRDDNQLDEANESVMMKERRRGEVGGGGRLEKC